MSRRLSTCRLAAVLLTCAACSKGPDGPADAGPPAQTPAAHLEAVKGEVKLEREGKLGAAQTGDLFQGDSLETGEDGEAKLRFPGGRFVEIGPDARFTLIDGEGGLVLKVERGLVLTRVPMDAALKPGEVQVSLAILTPFGLTRVGQSEVAIDVGEKSATVEVKIGTIELVSRNGELSKLAAGEKAGLGAQAPAEPQVLPVVEIQVTVQATGGKAELKKKDAKAWTAMGKKPQVLSPGDVMRVKDGRAMLQPEGSGTRLSLAKGAEAGFLGTTRGEVEETELELRKGELSGSLAPRQKSRLKLGRGLALVSDLGGQFTLVKTAGGFDVSVLAGDFKVERNGVEAKAVNGGQSAKVGAKDVEVTEAARDQLVVPSRMGLKFFHSGLSRASLVWDGEEGKAYRVEVANSQSYADPLLNGVVHQRFVSVPVPARGNLYWRVFDGAKEVDKGSAYFAPEPRAGGELDLRRNEVQDGADKTTIFFQDKPPAVTFTFAPDSAAARYKVAVFKEGALGTAVVEREVTQSQVVLDGALGEGKYLWSVTPMDNKGAGLRGGKMNKLEIVYDNAVPNLTIKSPRNGDAGGASVPVVGIAPVGAKVFVNGKAAELDDKGRFNFQAAPLPGGRMVFRMVSKSGAEVYTVRTVRR